MAEYSELVDYLRQFAQGGISVAFSGGVDSALLLKAACEAGAREKYLVKATTVRTPLSPPGENREAQALALQLGATFSIIGVPNLPDEILANNKDRCYLCKRLIFTEIRESAEADGIATVLDGTNADDLKEYRPGLKALKELGIISPLANLGFTKEDVRRVAREQGLPVAEKPSAPCLATRLPYGECIFPGLLERIHELETQIKALTGTAVLRARVHWDTVRLEVLPEAFPEVFREREEIIRAAKKLAFSRITLDLEGFRSGSFDKLEA